MSKQFNPAPGWPQPPQGWMPPQGWQPDPAWLPAPDGWQLFIDPEQDAKAAAKQERAERKAAGKQEKATAKQADREQRAADQAALDARRGKKLETIRIAPKPDSKHPTFHAATITLYEREVWMKRGKDESGGPLVGVSANVDTDGTITSRLSVTRMVGLGVFSLAAPKRNDTRSTYLTVESPDFAFVAIGTAENVQGIRKFAARVNDQARKAKALV